MSQSPQKDHTLPTDVLPNASKGLFHTSVHYVSTVYVAANSVVFMDLLPDKEPFDTVIKQITESSSLLPGTLVVDSFYVQRQRGIKCAASTIANFCTALSGADPRMTQFQEDNLLGELYTSFKRGKLHSNCKTFKSRASKSYFNYAQ